jgi:hypothetical protein
LPSSARAGRALHEKQRRAAASSRRSMESLPGKVAAWSRSTKPV